MSMLDKNRNPDQSNRGEQHVAKDTATTIKRASASAPAVPTDTPPPPASNTTPEPAANESKAPAVPENPFSANIFAPTAKLAQPEKETTERQIVTLKTPRDHTCLNWWNSGCSKKDRSVENTII